MIGETIRKLRKARRLPQSEAARRAGIAQSTWSLIESGRTARPHRSTLEAIRRVLERRAVLGGRTWH